MTFGTIMPRPMSASMTIPTHRMKSCGRWSRLSKVDPRSVNTVKLTTRPVTTR